MKFIEEANRRGLSTFKTAFAWKLKNYLKKYLGITKEGLVFYAPRNAEILVKDLNKEAKPLGYKPSLKLEHLDDIMDIYYNIHNKNIEAIEGCRKILQLFGTEVVRNNIDKNFWIDSIIRTSKDIEKHTDFLLISDYRFPNEEIEGAIKIRINTTPTIKSMRTGIPVEKIHRALDHDSERFISQLPVEYEFNNDMPNYRFTNEIDKLLKVLGKDLCIY